VCGAGSNFRRNKRGVEEEGVNLIPKKRKRVGAFGMGWRGESGKMAVQKENHERKLRNGSPERYCGKWRSQVGRGVGGCRTGGG